METKLHGSETRDSRDQQEVRPCIIPFSSEVNMSNCYYHCYNFFLGYESIHFNQLIAYWMMGGYLHPVDPVEEAYKKGHDILYDLIYEQGVLKLSDGDKDVIEFVKSAELKPNSCKHRGFCISQNVGVNKLLKLDEIGSVTLAEGVLKKREVVVNYGSSRGLQYLAHFNPTLDSVKPLLENVTEVSMLLLRGCESLLPTDIPLPILKTLTFLEISGSSYLTSIPENTISKLIHLKYLNLSDLLIESLPHDFFRRLRNLSWLIIRRCSKLRSLPEILVHEVLDLSHCTALQEIVTFRGQMMGELRMIDLSYTALTHMPRVESRRGVTHLFLRGSKLQDLEFLVKISWRFDCLRVLDLSGAREVKQISKHHLSCNLSVLDLSRTQIEYLEFNITESAQGCLRVMILRGCTSLLKLPSMSILPELEILDISGCEKLLELPEDLASLRNLMELNLSGCSGLGTLREGIFDQMSRLWRLDLSTTKVKHLPSFANLASLSELSLRDLELDSLETLKSLSNLVQLGLKGLKLTSSQELHLDDFLESLEKLQILNLSQTSVAK